jgi:hypothetical protein
MELERLDKICEIVGIQLDLHCQINPTTYQKMRLVSIVHSESNPEKNAEKEILYLRKKVLKLLRKILTPPPPIAGSFRRISYHRKFGIKKILSFSIDAANLYIRI